MILLIYVGKVGPLQCRFDNRLELFNEWCIGVVGLWSIAFTDMVIDYHTQYQLGWVIIAIVAVQIAINVAIFVFVSLMKSRLVVIKYYRRMLDKYERLTQKEEFKEM